MTVNGLNPGVISWVGKFIDGHKNGPLMTTQSAIAG